MKFIYHLIFYGFVFFLFFSCISTRELSYLGKQEQISADDRGYILGDGEPYRLQSGDIISVQINARDSDLSSLFGAQLTNNASISGVNEGVFYINGLTVKNDGTISLPLIGEVPLSGLTLEQARGLIKKNLYNLYKKDAVFIKIQLSGINYSIIGEVNRPGRYEIYKNRVSIFDAIAQAGDLTMTAQRANVKIIRQYPRGKKIISVDITEASILNSPYYYLQPNDILIINPKPQKGWGMGTGTFSVISSIIATAASVLTIAVNSKLLSK